MLGRFSRFSKPVYIVAGHRRSGTTMMMKALEVGGMKVVRAPKGDPFYADYELSTDQRSKDYWETPYERRYPYPYRGRLIKALCGSARYMALQEPGLFVVFMARSPEDIEASERARWGHSAGARAIAAAVDEEVDIYLNRDDVSRFLVMGYDAVLRDPKGELQRLHNLDWPINPDRAARTIDESRRHFKAGELIRA